ncbi:MAG: hypothetical protein PVH64_07270 [Bacillota bacterium]|jgi:hypothetical protein
MSIKLKKEILKNIAPFIQEKGFAYDESRSKLNARCFVFSKGDPEPTEEEMMKFIEGDRSNVPNREEILIGLSRLDQSISVQLRCFLKEPPITVDLGELTKADKQLWFSVADENKMNKSFKEILELMNLFGWKWFVLPQD